MSSTRIDWLYERKAVATLDVYLGLVGVELYEICKNFPPPFDSVEFADPSRRERYQKFWPQLKTPGPALMLELARLLDWEIDRDIGMIDRYMRSEAYADKLGDPLEVEVLHLLHQTLLDVLLWRKERSKRSFARSRLHQALQAFRQAVQRGASWNEALG